MPLPSEHAWLIPVLPLAGACFVEFLLISFKLTMNRLSKPVLFLLVSCVGAAAVLSYALLAEQRAGTAASKVIHASLFLGDQAYGIPELSSQSPFSPKIVITDSADKSDPLNLTISAGFKCFWTAMRLNPDYYVIMRRKTASTA